MTEQAHRKEPQVPGMAVVPATPADPDQAQEAERADRKGPASKWRIKKKGQD